MTIDKDGVLMTNDFDKEKFELIDQIIENQGDILTNQIPQALTTVISQKQAVAQPQARPQPPQPPRKNKRSNQLNCFTGQLRRSRSFYFNNAVIRL